ncbi:MAG: sensor histidine kinase [Flavipsychrobacter sp.]
MSTSTANVPKLITILFHFGDTVLEVNRDAYVSDVWVRDTYVEAERARMFKGRYIHELGGGPDLDTISALITECIDKRQDKYFEYFRREDKGNTRYVVRIVPLHEDADKAYLISDNLGVRYGAGATEDKWKMALDAAGDGMYDFNLVTGKMFFSDKWHEIFGYNIGEMSDGMDWSKLIHPDDQPLTARAFEAYINGEKPIYQVEFRYKCSDGSYKWVLSRGVVMSWTADGKPERLIGTHKDINERKQNEMALFKALENEKELGQMKTKFISIASHEFRTPLSTILSSAYLAAKYGKTEDQPKREKHLHRIVSSVTTLTDILNDFLSVGRLEEGKIHVRFSSIDVKLQTKTVVGEINTILKKGQRIFYNHTGDNEFYLDLALYKHIVINLLSNAIKFSPENASIYINTDIDKDKMTLSVKDNGIGIFEEDKRHLFERFYRGSNVGNIQGTGLGLHIVSKYVELQKGIIDCISEPGNGTEFIVRFYKSI